MFTPCANDSLRILLVSLYPPCIFLSICYIHQTIRRNFYIQTFKRNKKALRLSSQSFQLSRRLPIFTSRFQLTIFGTSKLNFCVRNGNRWNLTVIDTDRFDWISITHFCASVQYFYCNPAFRIVGNNSWIAFRNRCCFPRLSILSCDWRTCLQNWIITANIFSLT